MEKENDNFKIIDGKFKKLEANFAILKDTSTLWSEQLVKVKSNAMLIFSIP